LTLLPWLIYFSHKFQSFAFATIYFQPHFASAFLFLFLFPSKPITNSSLLISYSHISILVTVVALVL
jgi:hypothetical protein